jgi:hypothetical protein
MLKVPVSLLNKKLNLFSNHWEIAMMATVHISSYYWASWPFHAPLKFYYLPWAGHGGGSAVPIALTSWIFQRYSRIQSYDKYLDSITNLLLDSLDCDRNVATFNPANQTMSDSIRFYTVDSVIEGGLARNEFWKLFSRCAVCHNFMTTRTIESHVCPGAGNFFLFEWYNSFLIPIYILDAPQTDLAGDLVSKTYFLSLLDANGLESAAGVSKADFERIFYVCGECFGHMTQRVAEFHKCGGHGSREWPYYSPLPLYATP